MFKLTSIVDKLIFYSPHLKLQQQSSIRLSHSLTVRSISKSSTSALAARQTIHSRPCQKMETLEIIVIIIKATDPPLATSTRIVQATNLRVTSTPTSAVEEEAITIEVVPAGTIEGVSSNQCQVAIRADPCLASRAPWGECNRTTTSEVEAE